MPATNALLFNPNRWRDRAAKLRRIAAGMKKETVIKQNFRNMADHYDRIAEQMEDRIVGEPPLLFRAAGRTNLVVPLEA